MSELDSSVIRQLILSTKLGHGQIGDIVRSVLYAAVANGLLEHAPDIHYDNPLANKITSVIWELIMEGVYTPGLGMQQPNLPFLRVTEYGLKCFEAGELTLHDPDGYLQRLRVACPSIDETTIFYVDEALATFRIGRLVASSVMIGVAAENMLLRLVSAVHLSLDSSQKKNKFEAAVKNQKAKKMHDEVLARLKSPSTPLPPELDSVLTQHVDGIYDLIRRTRNDAGHPTGRLMQRSDTQALLLLFPTYCRTLQELMDWLQTNTI